MHTTTGIPFNATVYIGGFSAACLHCNHLSCMRQNRSLSILIKVIIRYKVNSFKKKGFKNEIVLESISLLSGGTAAYTSIYMNLWYLGNSEVGKLVVEQGFRLSLTCCFFSCVSYPVTSLLVNVYRRKKCPKNVVSFRVYLSLSAFLREIIYNAADITLCKNTISKPNQLEIQSYRSK